MHGIRGGSNPPRSTKDYYIFKVEKMGDGTARGGHFICNEDIRWVRIPCRSTNGVWRSLVARPVWVREVESSNLSTPTKISYYSKKK